MRIFISHSSHDAEKATGICSVLEGDGHSCFIAPRDIRPGREYAEEIINGICGADILLLLLSEQANQSPHVLREVERAGSSRIPIIVYKLEEVELTKSMEYFLMTNQWIDGTDDVDYRRAAEAFRNQSDPETNLWEQTQPQQSGGKRGAQGGWKKVVLAAALLVVIGLIVFAVGKAGPGGNVMADGRAGNSGSGMQGVDGITGDTGSGMQDTGGATGDADSGEQGTDSGALDAVDLSLGASVELGTYGGEPILWRVLHASENGEQLILVSDKILTMKAFDAAESGTYNSDGEREYWTTAIEGYDTAIGGYDLEAYVRGSNLWYSSNIRTWLNSEKESVTYEGQAPTSAAMSEKKNGYSNEAGFLNGFTAKEREVLREASLFTMGNVVMDVMGVNSKDRVFLLSEMELDWFAEADINVYAVPTENAVTQDQTGWYNLYSLSYGVEEYLWLLRDPAGDSTSRCRAVSNGYHADEMIYDQIEAGAEGYGIRPAICVDKRALAELIVSRD